MKKLNKRPTTRKSKTIKGTAIMKASAKTIVPAILVLFAVFIGTLIMMGPKQSLQTPPIEQKAMAYIKQHDMLAAGENVTGYKAISYYNYSKAAVVTDKRIFIYDKENVFSIPLDKISQVIIKDSEIGQQQVLIAAQSHGLITFDLYHTSVDKLIQLLHVPQTAVKHATKDVAEQDTSYNHKGKI